VLRTLVILLATLAVPRVALSACASDHQVATELRISLQRANRVWSGEADGVMGMAEVVRQSLVCVNAPLTPSDAATIHRTIGLTAAAMGDLETAKRVFGVAKGLQPDQPAPARSRAGVETIEAWYAAIPVDPMRAVDGEWLVDGTRAVQPPTDRVAVVQHLVNDVIIGTVWLDAGDPVPLTVGCPALQTRTAFAADITDAHDALARLDRQALTASIHAAESKLRCLSDALSEIEVAHLLRLQGASLWVAGPDQRSSAQVWLAAARALQPRYQFPPSIVAPRNPLALAVYQTLGDPVDSQRLPRGRGLVLVNGSPSDNAPVNHPWVVQHVENGVPTVGALVRPGDPIPAWPGPLQRALIEGPPPARSSGIRASALAVNVGAAALIGLGSGLWGGANGSLKTYCAPGPDGRRCPGNLGSRAVTQRSFGVGLVVTGAAMGGLGSGLVVNDLRRRITR
jgi:hypothetical protein